MLTSAQFFFRGPVWVVGGVIGAASTFVGILGDEFWMWACFGALALVAASFYSFHRSRMEADAKLESLPRRIDDLHREGVRLLGELSTRVEPKETDEGAWSISFSAPAERWDEAEAFDQRIRDLLIAEYPALLSDYAKGVNAHHRKQRERDAAKQADPERDTRSNAVKLREFTDHLHSRPASVVEASLEGLVVARHRVGS